MEARLSIPLFLRHQAKVGSRILVCVCLVAGAFLVEATCTAYSLWQPQSLLVDVFPDQHIVVRPYQRPNTVTIARFMRNTILPHPSHEQHIVAKVLLSLSLVSVCTPSSV